MADEHTTAPTKQPTLNPRLNLARALADLQVARASTSIGPYTAPLDVAISLVAGCLALSGPT